MCSRVADATLQYAHAAKKKGGVCFGGRLVEFAIGLVCTKYKLVSVVGRLSGVRTSFLLAHFPYFNFYNKNGLIKRIQYEIGLYIIYIYTYSNKNIEFNKLIKI